MYRKVYCNTLIFLIIIIPFAYLCIERYIQTPRFFTIILPNTFSLKFAKCALSLHNCHDMAPQDVRRGIVSLNVLSSCNQLHILFSSMQYLFHVEIRRWKKKLTHFSKFSRNLKSFNIFISKDMKKWHTLVHSSHFSYFLSF